MNNNYPNSDWLMRQALISIENLRNIPDDLKTPLQRQLIAEWDADIEKELEEMTR